MSECLFCRIISGELPAYCVYEDKTVFAFMDIKPVNPGHLLIVPKQHSTNFLDLPSEEIGPIFNVVQKLAKTTIQLVEAKGFNLIVNNGSVAGQMIFHTHIHIIPRFENDGLQPWPSIESSTDDLKELAERIKNSLN